MMADLCKEPEDFDSVVKRGTSKNTLEGKPDLVETSESSLLAPEKFRVLTPKRPHCFFPFVSNRNNESSARQRGTTRPHNIPNESLKAFNGRE